MVHAPFDGLRKPVMKTGRADRGVSATRRVALAPHRAQCGHARKCALRMHTHITPTRTRQAARCSRPRQSATPGCRRWIPIRRTPCLRSDAARCRPPCKRMHARRMRAVCALAYALLCAQLHVCACRTACLHLCASSLSPSPSAFGRVCGSSKIPCVASKIAIGSVAS